MNIVETYIVKKPNGELLKIHLLANGTYVEDRGPGRMKEISKADFEKFEYW